MQVKCERVLNTCLSKELLLPFKFSAKIIREIEYEKAGFYTVLVRIMHARRECKISDDSPRRRFRRTEESDYGHREGKNRGTTSGWIYIITRSGSLASSGNWNPFPKDYRSLERVVTIFVHPLREPFLPILFSLDRYPSRKELLNRFNLGSGSMILGDHNWRA